MSVEAHDQLYTVSMRLRGFVKPTLFVTFITMSRITFINYFRRQTFLIGSSTRETIDIDKI